MSETAIARREALIEVYREAKDCHRCPLADSRTKVVFGAGDADADLMFVGEAPGAEEDRQGLPFVGRAGQLLNQLLSEIGLARDDVFITNVLKCLRYNALVQLADGSWERIGRLVRSRYDGEVMSVDQSGTLVPRRVIGWHATPLAGRTVFKLRYASGKSAGSHRIGIQLTGDHPVLTRRGYVRVDELRRDDEVATGQGLTDLEFDLICGSLLGDATIRRETSMLQFSHSQRQLAYALFKANLLKELRPTYELRDVKAVVGGEETYGAVHVRTPAWRSLRIVRRDFYRDSKVVPSWLPERFNERMLAVWFMDDGYMRIRPPRRPSAQIATECFDPASIQLLLRGLRGLGLVAKASPDGRISFGVEETAKLSQLIGPLVPELMRWKLSPETDASFPFDPKRWLPGKRRVLFDRVEVEDLTEEHRADTTFFCIDVEGTHNFVTSGGVVHNCRPPGNRDPQPEEIEACWPYLERQIQLIEPRVIATLGNFATKRITGSPVGITRVRGTPQVHELAGRTLFVLPLLHPAAALRTPAMVDTLREDFARLRALLDEPLPVADVEVDDEPAPDPASQLDLFG